MSLSLGAFALVVLPGEERLADVLRDDLAEHHPLTPVVVVTPAASSRLRGAVPAADLGDEAALAAEGWSGEDLRTALAPYALRRAQERSSNGTAMLLAPGFRLLAPLPPVAPRGLGLLTNPGAVDVPADGKEPDVTTATRQGPYSQGLLLAGPESDALLARWCALTTTTRWVDAPSRPLFAVAAEAAAAAGAATVCGDGLLVDPRWRWDGAAPPLVDLRAYRRDTPWVLDAGARTPRTLLSRHPGLADLVARHRAGIVGGATSGRTALEATLARRWREEGGTPDFETWLAQPVPVAPPSEVPRALAGIWTSRPDLRAIMPLGLHQDARVLARWWLEHGVSEQPFPDAVRAAIEALAAREPAVAPDPTPGITVAGYLGAALGLGTMGRLLVEAARRTGHPVSLVENHRTANPSAAERPDGLPEGLLHTTTLLAVTGDQTPGFAHDLPAGWREGRRTIGVWAWELDELPPSHQAGFAHVDEVWTISTFVRDAVAAVAPCPVEVVPLPVPLPPEREEPVDRSALVRLGIPTDRPYVLFAMDLLSDLHRKNPLGVVEAHRRAFPEGDGPLLVLKLINGDKRVAEAERLRLLARERQFLVVEEVLPQAELELLMAGATAYVSLHRSEGFGLTLAEAMAHAVPTVATAYGGNLDFMDEEVSLLVPFEEVYAPADSAYYGGRWAEPDLDAAAAAVRRLVDDEAFARELGRRGRRRVAERCSWERTTAFLLEQVERTEQWLQPDPEPAPPSPPPPPRLTRRVRRRLGRALGR